MLSNQPGRGETSSRWGVRGRVRASVPLWAGARGKVNELSTLTWTTPAQHSTTATKQIDERNVEKPELQGCPVSCDRVPYLYGVGEA